MSVFFPNKPDAWMDFDYYARTHIPMVLNVLPPLRGTPPGGRGRIEVSKGVQALDGTPPPYLAVSRLWLNNMEELAMLAQNEQVMADSPKFSNITVLAQIDEVLELS
jgi:uncharacterized protein (TIGR02118 family)